MSHQLNINVSGDPRADAPYLVCDNPPGGTLVHGTFEGTDGSLPNRCVFIAPNGLSGGGSVYYDQGRKTFRVMVPNVDGAWEATDPMCWPPEYGDPAVDFDKVAMHYGVPLAYLSPLSALGSQFYYRDGPPHTLIGASAFRLHERVLRGWDVVPFLDQMQEIGINLLRVWLLNTSVGHILPSEWGPEFYSRLPETLGLCGARGLDVEFTVFTQTQTLMPVLADQQRHYNAVVDAVADKFCFIEGGNELDSHDNAYDPRLHLFKPAGATFDLCSGSNGSDAWVVTPVLNSSRYHSNDANEWQRRQGHNPMEGADATRRPCFANENTRPDRDPHPYKFHDAARCGALLHAGSTFHCNEGKDVSLFDGLSLECAKQHVVGAQSVDLTQRVFPYVHRTDLEGNGIIRAYQRGAAIVTVRG